MELDTDKILAEQLLQLNELGKTYDENFREYLEHIRNYRKAIEEKFRVRVEDYTRVDAAYPVKSLDKEIRSHSGIYAERLFGVAEKQFADPEKIGEL